MVGARVAIGALAPWEMRTVYFKVNCSGARARKHVVLFDLVEPAMPDANHANRRAAQTIFATRSGYNPVTKEFVTECDAGRVFLKLREITAEYASLREAVRCARKFRAEHGDATPDRMRRLLTDVLEGRSTDLCELKRLLDCICSCGWHDGQPAAAERAGPAATY